jgi:hypothetical protein
MSKKIVFVGLIFVLVLSSCALPGGISTKANTPAVEPTIAQPAQPVQPVQPVEPTQPVEPAQPAPAVAAAEPTAKAVEPTQTEQAAGTNFRDDFDLSNDNFTADLTTTTQAANADQIRTEPSSVQDGILVFTIKDNETYIYKFVKGSMAEDTVIEAKWKSNGVGMNGVALVCRAAEDNSSWYEMRVSSQGEWQMLRYDKSIRENDPNKNPYVTIKKGIAKTKLIRLSGDNVSKFSCIGSKLTYEVNGTKILETNNSDIKSGGMYGLGVMSSVYLPVVIQWDYFSVTTP